MQMDTRLTLVLIRHAIAENRSEFARTGRPDGERPLTAEGRRKMRIAARGLRRVLPEIHTLASSPLVRAWQTAEIISAAYDGLPVEKLDAAAAGDGDGLLGALRGTAPGTIVAVVGHEPTQARWTAWLLSGRAGGFVGYEKGEACALAFERRIEPGGAELLWKVRPKQLRALGSDDGKRRVT